MLHRAATSAYSWWWASHIRTKQSKWLEQNLEDMEEKVQSMLKIIEQEGDSFAKRAEMYYRKRPELINFVEESFRAYRALAERFDHISKDLQSANRTIATVFPEQVQLGLESDDDDSQSGSTAPSPDRASTRNLPIPKNMPKAPKPPKQSSRGQNMLAAKREQLRRNIASGGPAITSSGLTKEAAFKEIDTLQKDILSFQTEKEFIKSAYESAMAKFLELESKITESQGKVCSLQDEFGIGTIIEDHEARSLMAGTALKSCAEALTKLQDEQQRSMGEVQEEYDRIKEAHERLQALKKLQGEEEDLSDKALENKGTKRFVEAIVNIEVEEGENVDALREKIREQLKVDSNSTFTEPEMAEKIEDLVEKIVGLETVVCTQNALVKRLRQEIDSLLEHIKSLEERKKSVGDKDSSMSERLRELEEELARVKSLNKEVVDHKNNLSAEITEAGCNLDHLTEKLQNVKPDESESLFVSKEEKGEKEERESEIEKVEREIMAEKEDNDASIESHQEIKEEEEKQDMSRIAESTLDSDIPLAMEDGLNWRQLYMNNVEDREKILVEEYTMILRDYKNMKMNLSEMDKKHRDNIFELASHVRELRNTIAARDEEIRMLRKKLRALQSNGGSIAEESIFDEQENLEQNGKDEDEKNDDIGSHNDSDRKPLFHHLYDRDAIMAQAINENEKEDENQVEEPKESVGKRVKINLVTKTRPISRTEGRYRAELDDLLESNLDFWLRFSTSFHQIQKFQTSIKDLLAEIVKLKEAKKKEGSNKLQQPIKSDARPIYKHLSEINTELTLWLEHSDVFEGELKSRFSSIHNIQDEINKVKNNKSKEDEKELDGFQAAKFIGEIDHMKSENSKVAEELQAGKHRVKLLQGEVRKALYKLDKEFGFAESKSRSRPRIPLHSFLFGVKLKKHKQKPSMFDCVNAPLPKHHSSLLEFPE